MRRLLAIVLLLGFSFPLISPMVAVAAGSEANLPACCRRNGAHHCMMKMQQPEGGIVLAAIPAKCPAYPAAVTPVRHGNLSLYASSVLFGGIVSQPSAGSLVADRVWVALDLSPQKRGPPAELL